MPNPRLCRIEMLKRSGNSVNPADAPSPYSASCGIVRCASQAMEEAQHLPSGSLTIPLPLVSVVGAPANCLGKAGFQAGQECAATHVLGGSPHGSVRNFDLRLAPE